MTWEDQDEEWEWISIEQMILYGIWENLFLR
jgi:hypothetical protein